MLQAAVLLSFLRRIQRFSTSGRPEALVACPRRELGRTLRGGLTLTATGLPSGPASRRQLSGHTIALLGISDDLYEKHDTVFDTLFDRV